MALAVLLLAVFLFCLSYWWLGNLWHEVVGTGFLLLLLRHLWSNRRWWDLRRGSWTVLRGFVTGLTIILALDVLLVAATSIAISRSFLPQIGPSSFTLREMHWFAAYWMIPLIGLHLGLHARRIGTMARQIMPFHLYRWHWLITGALVLGAVQGLWSGAVLGLWPRLMFQYSMSMWDFTTAVWPFFLHWMAVLALFVVAGRAIGGGLGAGLGLVKRRN